MIPISDQDLAHFMDEALAPADMARIESELRESASLRKRLDAIRQNRDRGWHSVGAIWRGHRLSCPTRSQLGSYLLDALDPQWHDYIRFHTETVGCRICQANLADLRVQSQTAGTAQASKTRQHRFVRSSQHLLGEDKST